MAEVTNTPLSISYFVRDITNALLTYDRLRWWKSVTGPNGLYEAITAPAAAVASLTSPFVEPHELNGKTLSIEVSGTQIDVTFVGADPVDSATAAAEIGAASGLITAAADGDGKVVISTVATGTGASIKVLESDGATALGFQTGDCIIGVGTDTVLVAGTHQYFFTDQNSDNDFYYRTQLIDSGSAAMSELSIVIPANEAQSVPVSQTIVAFMRLVNLAGNPILNRKVTLSNTFQTNRVDVVNDQSAGVFRGYLEKETDRNGYVEFRVLRGIELDIAVEATNFVRRITVPTTGDSVDLLDPSLVTRDEFGIQEQNVDFAIRLS